MPTISVEELTIDQVHRAYQDGLYTAEQLVTAYLERIQRLDRDESGPKLNAVLAINSQAGAQATELDEKFKREGKLSGPLHGIPILLKDTIKTAGLTTTFGSVVGKDYVPKEDAFLVTKLKEAGAIILAKGSMPDWGCDYFSTSSASGNTLNPYDLKRDSGGSSSGPAAAVAANLTLVAVGSDSAGSIRIPASFCNVVGFRPTSGLVSSRGCLSGIRLQGTQAPIARTVKDAAIILDAIACFDKSDPATSIHALAPFIDGGYAAHLKTVALPPARIGVIPALFGKNDNVEQAAVNTVIHTLLDKLREAGTVVVEVQVPELEKHLASTSQFLTRFRADCDKVIQQTFNKTIADIVTSGQIPKENVALPYVAHYGIASPYTAGADGTNEFAKQVDALHDFREAVLTQMLKHNVSAFVFPTTKQVAPRHVDLDQTMRATFPINTGFASQLQWPAVSLPAGYTDKENMPVGLEIVMPPLKDGELLSLAQAIEKLVPARRAPKL